MPIICVLWQSFPSKHPSLFYVLWFIFQPIFFCNCIIIITRNDLIFKCCEKSFASVLNSCLRSSASTKKINTFFRTIFFSNLQGDLVLTEEGRKDLACYEENHLGQIIARNTSASDGGKKGIFFLFHRLS